MSCIEAHGKPRNNGYVRLTIKGKKWYAHRLAWTQAHGPIPEGMDICHKCDNRRCINVEHLFVGTRLDNMRDAASKGRISRGDKHSASVPKGEANHMAKLTKEAVEEIRSAKWPRGARRQLAEKFGVHESLIGLVIRNKIWRHI